LISDGKAQEHEYGHLFDRVITNVDPDRTLMELRACIHRLDTEPAWVPIAWLPSAKSAADQTPAGTLDTAL
jgi:hypothetical protein